MTDWREELIEKMAKAAWESDGTTCDLLLETYLTEARAALAVAEPVIREQADNVLREENARLREVLKPFVKTLELNCTEAYPGDFFIDQKGALRVSDLRAARAAILGKVKAEGACPEPDEAP